jgi:WD40 repeat protein
LEGYSYCVNSVAYSPDGRHIISGSDDNTIRIWDAESGAAVGNPLEGQTHLVNSVTYSPDGQHATSVSNMSMRPLHPKSGNPTQRNLIAHVPSVYYPPNPQQVDIVSLPSTSHVPDGFTINISPCTTIQASLKAHPDREGWVRDTAGGLLYWVPPDYRVGLHSPCLLTISLHSRIRSASLNFDCFAFGISWTHIFNNAHL